MEVIFQQPVSIKFLKKNFKMWKAIIYSVLIIFCVDLFVSRISEEVTIYEESCLSGKGGGIFKCAEEGGVIDVERRRFKVDFNNQRVIENDVLFLNSECVVFDAYNWRCKGKDYNSEFTFSMRDGDFYDSLSVDHSANSPVIQKKQIHVTVYWYYRIKGFFG